MAARGDHQPLRRAQPDRSVVPLHRLRLSCRPRRLPSAVPLDTLNEPCASIRALHLDSLKERRGEAGHSPGHARPDDPDDPRPRADARLRHLAAARRPQSRSVPRQSGIAVPVALPPGAGRQAEGGMAGDREQSPRQVLPPDGLRPAPARTASRAMEPRLASPSPVCWRAHDAPASPGVRRALDGPPEPGRARPGRRAAGLRRHGCRRPGPRRRDAGRGPPSGGAPARRRGTGEGARSHAAAMAPGSTWPGGTSATGCGRFGAIRRSRRSPSRRSRSASAG